MRENIYKGPNLAAEKKHVSSKVEPQGMYVRPMGVDQEDIEEVYFADVIVDRNKVVDLQVQAANRARRTGNF